MGRDYTLGGDTAVLSYAEMVADRDYWMNRARRAETRLRAVSDAVVDASAALGRAAEELLGGQGGLVRNVPDAEGAIRNG